MNICLYFLSVLAFSLSVYCLENGVVRDDDDSDCGHFQHAFCALFCKNQGLDEGSCFAESDVAEAYPISLPNDCAHGTKAYFSTKIEVDGNPDPSVIACKCTNNPEPPREEHE